jgi:error-prone DNA polymerase
MVDRTVVQWDKDDVAHTGLVKIDVLALGMLSVIQACTELLRPFGLHFEMADLTYDDPLVYDMICEADTVGLFQIESRAQMNTLPRLRPRCFYDLVVEVALIRPGPIQGDMVHPYLRRRQGKEAVTYAHPSLRPILERTLGIPLFQEQAMKMAIVAAGFTPAEADRLRKVMGFKRASDEMEALLEKMVDGMRRNGLDEKTARDIRNQLCGFAAYGFPESHSASFALIVYASAHLKRHFPAAFFAAMLNCQPLGFYSPASLVQDARRHGLTVLPVCVAESGASWTLPDLHSIRAGLAQIDGLGLDPARAIEEERQVRGPFGSIDTFCDRVVPRGVDRGQLEHIALSGALGCFGLDRRQALWAVQGWRHRLPLEGPARATQVPLFPSLSPGALNLLDHRTAGFSSDGHPLRHLRDDLTVRGYLGASALRGLRGGSRVQVAGVVITRQRPQTAKGTLFITLEDEGGFMNIVVWADTFERHRRLLRQVRFLAAWGRIDTQDGVIHVIADRFADLGREPWALLGTRPQEGLELRSRDFH